MTRQQIINCKNRNNKEIVNEILFLKNVTGQDEFILLEAKNTTEEKIRQMLRERGINKLCVRQEDIGVYTIGIY